MQLNEAQQQAATAGDGPQLILAAAGSGKTRTIVHRIGYLIGERRIAPHRILAVTFTNKAAAELKSRLSDLIGDDGGGVVSGTFHAISLRFLRRYAEALDYPRDFQVIDADDQKVLVKRILKARNISSDVLHPSYVMSWIEHCKHAGVSFEQAPEDHWNGISLRELYGQYQAELKHLQRMDFSDLLLNVVRLLSEYPEVAAALKSRFDHVLVDEYQDTNPVQSRWLTLLCEDHRNLTVVGDDDQSIYGWRGADVRHILDFEHIWKNAGIHKLEENYRSSQSILKLANAVIHSNSDRHEKVLRAVRGEGERPRWLVCNDEYDEARRIQRFLRSRRDAGVAWQEMAVLYRSNRQSLPIEQVLREEGLPYRIIGGVGFFERMEIRDAMAYWALLQGCGDSLQLLRICNTPKRGIGTQGQESLRQMLSASGLRAHEWLDVVAGGQAEGTAKKLEPLAQLMRDLRQTASALPDRGLMALLEESGYIKSLEARGELEAETRLENIRELQRYIELSMGEGLTPVEFMDRAALLQAGEDRSDPDDDNVISLMSLHRAKGLEFDTVVLAGVEEGMLPHQRALDEGESGIAEERRLLYVGITRAKEQLLLTSARIRRLFGEMSYPMPSRFIKSLPPEVLEKEEGYEAQPAQSGSSTHEGLQIGCNVRHPTFGEGVLLGVEGSGDAVRVSVQFRRVGLKRLMLKYAALEPV